MVTLPTPMCLPCSLPAGQLLLLIAPYTSISAALILMLRLSDKETTPAPASFHLILTIVLGRRGTAGSGRSSVCICVSVSCSSQPPAAGDLCISAAPALLSLPSPFLSHTLSLSPAPPLHVETRQHALCVCMCVHAQGGWGCCVLVLRAARWLREWRGIQSSDDRDDAVPSSHPPFHIPPHLSLPSPSFSFSF